MAKKISSSVGKGGSNLRYSELFDVVFEAVREDIRLGLAPTSYISSGRGLVRIANAEYVLGANRTPAMPRIKSCLEVRDGASGSDSNRFTGSSPNFDMVQGGVYFSMHATPLILETAHYNGSFNAALRQGKAIISLTTKKPMMLLDLSGHSASASQFLDRIGRRKKIRTAIDASSKIRGKSLSSLAFSPTDYSVARAIGLAAGFHHFLDGILFKSARTTATIDSGDNLVLLGQQTKVVSNGLKIESVWISRKSRKRKEMEFKKYEF